MHREVWIQHVHGSVQQLAAIHRYIATDAAGVVTRLCTSVSGLYRSDLRREGHRAVTSILYAPAGEQAACGRLRGIKMICVRVPVEPLELVAVTGQVAKVSSSLWRAAI
jgi:hypothetical protein